LDNFNILIMIGRPASGKSEIIDFLKHLDSTERREKYHIAELDVLDDFPMLWVWFEEDHILSNNLGKPRLFTDEQGYFLHHYMWDLLVERLALEYQKRLRDNPAYHERFTTIIEFSRGSEHEGYERAISHLSEEVLCHAGIVYVDVPYEESLRKNRKRFNPERPDSILEHALPDEKLERLYHDDDWKSLTEGNIGFLEIKSIPVPYVVFENADDVTTSNTPQLAIRLESVFAKLWELRR
jgi:hypothetical protein